MRDIPNGVKFQSLTQARIIRDRLAGYAVEDIQQFQTKATAEATVDRICRAEGKWKREIQDLIEHCGKHWNGHGIPDFQYFRVLRAAIFYISTEERKAIPRKS